MNDTALADRLTGTRLRCLAVAVLASTLLLGLVVLCLLPLQEPARLLLHGSTPERPGARTTDPVLLLASVVGVLAALRLEWLVLDTCWKGARGLPVPRDGWTRRLTLAACGVAVSVTALAPAHAGGLSDLDGLPHPDRPVVGRVEAPEPVASPAADHAPAPPARPAPPGTPTQAPAPSALPEQAEQTPGSASAHVPTPAAGTGSHRVVPGDTLWGVARAQLDGSRSGTSNPSSRVSDAAVARHTRLLHHANRTVVGTDPDLLLPGQELTLPAPTPQENR